MAYDEDPQEEVVYTAYCKDFTCGSGEWRSVCGSGRAARSVCVSGRAVRSVCGSGRVARTTCDHGARDGVGLQGPRSREPMASSWHAERFEALEERLEALEAS